MTELQISFFAALADRYVLQRELGRGGMATVYLVNDLRHDRPVALKVLHPELAVALGPERFLREIQLTARLDHPHILPVFDSGEAAGLLWYTMPYAEGESLRERLRREVQLPLEEALQIAGEVADALECAHQQGILHRDIKPENILLSRGHARVADFGVGRAVAAAADSRLTEPGMAVGTPAYMSPEQATGGVVDARTDVYALGCVVYEMLAGEPPFIGPTPQAVIARRLTETPRLLSATRQSVPAHVEEAVGRALAKSPADRFRTPAEFAHGLARGNAITLSAVSSDPAPRPAPDHSRVRPKRIAALVASLGLVVIIAAVLLWQRDHVAGPAVRRPPAEAEPPPNDPLRRPAAGGPSLAVLPFTNLSPHPENEYFSDGMTEELISALGRVQGLRVAARASSFTFKGKPLDVVEVSRKLNVDAVLDGSVRREGNRLRVTAELVRAADGTRLWADRYDRELRDVFAVQEELAQAIAGALMPSLTPRPFVARGAPLGRNLGAYDLYLRGRHAWGRRTQASLDEARRLYEQAITLDSGYAQAYAGLADVYLSLPNFTRTHPLEPIAKAESLALRAIALDSALAEAHATLGAARAQLHYDWEGAKGEFDQALALNPSYPTAYRFLSIYYLRPRGRHDEELEAARQAHELDPLSTGSSNLLGVALVNAGRPDEAIARLRTTLQTDPGYGGGEGYRLLTYAYLAKRKYREALAAYQDGIREGFVGPEAWGGLGYAYARSGDRQNALRMLSRMEKEATKSYVAPTQFALVYIGLGDKDRAFEWYRRACESHNLGVFGFPFGPLTASLRGDPRHDSILRCMRLLDKR